MVTGPPGAGKSTLSRELATLLGLPLLAKDDFKQALLDDAPVADRRRLAGDRKAGRGGDAVRGEAGGTGVLDSVWVDRDRALREISALQEIG